MKNTWTAKELTKLYRLERTKSSIYRDEAEGIIPLAKRVKRGKTFFRVWDLEQLPAIGMKYRFLRPLTEKKIIAIYSPKGGVLKSTFAFNLARILAINGISVLVIGLDVQATISMNLRMEEQENFENITDIKEINGLYEASKSLKENGCSIENTICSSNLPNLKYIPESSNLVHLEQKIRDESKREFYLQRLLKPVKENFEVVIFDNSPNWNFLIQNSLVLATDVICPIACDIETYRSLTQNIQMVNDYKEKMELTWNNFILVSTKLERTKISTQIEAQYKTIFPQLITSCSIRSAVQGQESSLDKISAIEYNPDSALADDYYSVIKEIWEKINPTHEDVEHKKHKNKRVIEGK